MTFAERYAKMEPRERKLLGGLVVVTLVIVFLIIPAYLFQLVSTKRDDNQEIRDYIAKVHEQRTRIEKMNATRTQIEARYSKAMPQLATFVEDAAKANQLEIEESGSRPDVPHGKKYVEHVLFMKLRGVGLLAIVKTFEKIERSGFPVSITRLNIKPKSDPDSFDVEAHVSAYERKGEKKEAPKEAPEEPEEEEQP